MLQRVKQAIHGFLRRLVGPIEKRFGDALAAALRHSPPLRIWIAFGVFMLMVMTTTIFIGVLVSSSSDGPGKSHPRRSALLGPATKSSALRTGLRRLPAPFGDTPHGYHEGVLA